MILYECCGGVGCGQIGLISCDMEGAERVLARVDYRTLILQALCAFAE